MNKNSNKFGSTSPENHSNSEIDNNHIETGIQNSDHCETSPKCMESGDTTESESGAPVINDETPNDGEFGAVLTQSCVIGSESESVTDDMDGNSHVMSPVLLRKSRSRAVSHRLQCLDTIDNGRFGQGDNGGENKNDVNGSDDYDYDYDGGGDEEQQRQGQGDSQVSSYSLELSEINEEIAKSATPDMDSYLRNKRTPKKKTRSQLLSSSAAAYQSKSECTIKSKSRVAHMNGKEDNYNNDNNRNNDSSRVAKDNKHKNKYGGYKQRLHRSQTQSERDFYGESRKQHDENNFVATRGHSQSVDLRHIYNRHYNGNMEQQNNKENDCNWDYDYHHSWGQYHRTDHKNNERSEKNKNENKNENRRRNINRNESSDRNKWNKSKSKTKNDKNDKNGKIESKMIATTAMSQSPHIRNKYKRKRDSDKNDSPKRSRQYSQYSQCSQTMSKLDYHGNTKSRYRNDRYGNEQHDDGDHDGYPHPHPHPRHEAGIKSMTPECFNQNGTRHERNKLNWLIKRGNQRNQRNQHSQRNEHNKERDLQSETESLSSDSCLSAQARRKDNHRRSRGEYGNQNKAKQRERERAKEKERRNKEGRRERRKRRSYNREERYEYYGHAVGSTMGGCWGGIIRGCCGYGTFCRFVVLSFCFLFFVFCFVLLLHVRDKLVNFKMNRFCILNFVFLFFFLIVDAVLFKAFVAFYF